MSNPVMRVIDFELCSQGNFYLFVEPILPMLRYTCAYYNGVSDIHVHILGTGLNEHRFYMAS